MAMNTIDFDQVKKESRAQGGRRGPQLHHGFPVVEGQGQPRGMGGTLRPGRLLPVDGQVRHDQHDLQPHHGADSRQAGHLLINLYGLLYKEITASSLVEIDLDGNVIHKPDTDYGINKSGYVIHGCIHRARPDASLRDPYPYARRHGRVGDAFGLLPITHPRRASTATSATTSSRARPSTWPSSSDW